MTDPNYFLQEIYDKAIEKLGSSNEISSKLDGVICNYLNDIIEKSESAKGVITVIITSIVYKRLHPETDIRNHQTSIPNGYSGRTFDTKYITPFLREKQFPSMAESGWLTRSLEQKKPYTKNYSGAIRPESLKSAFLNTIDFIQNGNNLDEVLIFLLQGLIIQRNKQLINLAKPIDLPIAKIINLLTQHFNHKYYSQGGSRLPVLAIYAAYQSIIIEAKRFENKKLNPIESHTAADARSGSIGDIEIVDENNRPFEGVEIKHGIPISYQIVRNSYEKFKSTQVNRYYILSTSDIDKEELHKINLEIERIKNIHGCQVIVNGVISTLKYYLRLVYNTSEFIENYVTLLENDTALKFEHKEKWNDLTSHI